MVYKQKGSRIRSKGPVLQNIPIRTELGRQIGRAFQKERPLFINTDYSGLELRVIAQIREEDEHKAR